MGQQANSIFTLPVVAAGVIAAYRGVTFADLQVTVAGAKIKGISKRAALAIGQTLEAACIGTATCEAGAAFAKGAALAMDASGRVIAATALTAAPGLGTLAIAAGAVPVLSTAADGAIITGTPAAPVLSGGDLPQYIVGHALEAAVAVGDFVEVLLCR